MINNKTGDLLSTKGIIVHGCNCQGVMGSGVAKQVKHKYPDVFNSYQQKCNVLPVEKLLGTIDTVFVSKDTMIVNAFTQETYGRIEGEQYVDYEAIRSCFQEIDKLYDHWGYLPVNFPLIGCGLGGGDWDAVSKIIEEEMDDDWDLNLWTQPTGVLSCWYYIPVNDTHGYFVGNIYNDIRGRFYDGQIIHTSITETKDFEEGMLVTTSNSKYLLGKEMELS